jgi:hypothetical protein
MPLFIDSGPPQGDTKESRKRKKARKRVISPYL